MELPADGVVETESFQVLRGVQIARNPNARGGRAVRLGRPFSFLQLLVRLPAGRYQVTVWGHNGSRDNDAVNVTLGGVKYRVFFDTNRFRVPDEEWRMGEGSVADPNGGGVGLSIPLDVPEAGAYTLAISPAEIGVDIDWVKFERTGPAAGEEPTGTAAPSASPGVEGF
jgi:hypothetical protein